MPEAKTIFMNGPTGMVVDPSGSFTSKGDSVQDEKECGERGMGVALGYNDLAGVVQNPRLHTDYARRMPTLNRIVCRSKKRE